MAKTMMRFAIRMTAAAILVIAQGICVAGGSSSPTLVWAGLNCNLGVCSPIMVLSNSTNQAIAFTSYVPHRMIERSAEPKVIHVRLMPSECRPVYLGKIKTGDKWIDASLPTPLKEETMPCVLQPSESVMFGAGVGTNDYCRVGVRYWTGMVTNTIWSEDIDQRNKP